LLLFKMATFHSKTKLELTILSYVFGVLLVTKKNLCVMFGL
jgi:hypothetical protein